MTTLVVLTVVILVLAALLVAGGALDRPRRGVRRERLVRPRTRLVERPARRVVVEEEVPAREVVREERRIVD